MSKRFTDIQVQVLTAAAKYIKSHPKEYCQLTFYGSAVCVGGHIQRQMSELGVSFEKSVSVDLAVCLFLDMSFQENYSMFSVSGTNWKPPYGGRWEEVSDSETLGVEGRESAYADIAHDYLIDVANSGVIIVPDSTIGLT